MDANTMRELVRQITLDRDETAARLAKADALLSNLEELYPELFREGNVQPPPRPTAAQDDRPQFPNGGTAAIIPATDTKSIVDYIFNDVAKVPDIWLTPKEVADLAQEYGWKAEDSPDPVAVIRTRVSRMTNLDSRQRDGRTKEYRLQGACSAEGEPETQAVDDSPVRQVVLPDLPI